MYPLCYWGRESETSEQSCSWCQQCARLFQREHACSRAGQSCAQCSQLEVVLCSLPIFQDLYLQAIYICGINCVPAGVQSLMESFRCQIDGKCRYSGMTICPIHANMALWFPISNTPSISPKHWWHLEVHEWVEGQMSVITFTVIALCCCCSLYQTWRSVLITICFDTVLLFEIQNCFANVNSATQCFWDAA